MENVLEAVALINELEITRRAIVKEDGRSSDFYKLVERFKELDAKKNWFLARWSEVGSFSEELKEALEEAGIVIGGNLTPSERTKFSRAMGYVHPEFKRAPRKKAEKTFLNTLKTGNRYKSRLGYAT